MAGHCLIESKHSSFDDDRTVHPWNKLVDEFCQRIAPEEMERLMFLAKPHLGVKYQLIKASKDYCQFFNLLEDKCKDDTVDVVQNLFRSIELHDDSGHNFSYAELIGEYKLAKRKFDAKNRQLKNNNFVGRESLLTDIIHCLSNDERLKGVILCGMSGIGKTAVANEVCCRLKTQRWRILRISQMEKTDIRDLYRDVLYGCVHTFMPSSKLDVEDDIHTLKLQLKTVFTTVMAEHMAECGQRTLMYIDNVDGHCLGREQLKQFNEFMDHLLRCIHSMETGVKVRLLVTVRRNLIETIEPLMVEKSCYGNQMIQKEVQPLDDSDAAVLLRKISKRSEMDLTDEICRKINETVGGNSMFLKHVAMNLPFTTRVDWMSADKLLANLFSPLNELSTKLDLCLEKSIRMLDSPHDQEMMEVRQVLINLSLFKSAWFCFEDAVKVGIRLNEDSFMVRYNRKHAHESRMILSLLSLKTQHLIELDKTFAECDEGGSKIEHFKLYYFSLHPLVYQYLQARYVKRDGGEMGKQTDLQQASVRFMRHFCSQIDKCGKQYGIKPHTAQALLERNRVHIRHFYEYFLNANVALSDIIDKKESSSVIHKFKNLWKIVEMVQSAETRVNFARRLCSDAERDSLQFPFVYWKCKEVEFLLSVGKTDNAIYTFTDLSNKFQLVHSEYPYDIEQLLCRTQSNWKLEEEERKPMLAVFFETKGRVLKEEKKDNPQVVHWFKCAEKKYAEIPGIKTLYRDDRARVVNLIGCFYFENGEFEKSKQEHKMAFNIIQGLKAKHVNEDVDGIVCNHLNSSEYLTNIAACEHQLAEQTEDRDGKERLLRSALRKYTICIDYDKEIKKDSLHSHAVALMNRAELHYLLKLMELAIEDATKALHIFKSFYSMPKIQKTLAFTQNAYFRYKLGKKCSNADERKEMLRKAVSLYDDALSEIMFGGLPMDHKEFKDIKDFHIKAMKTAGMAERDIEQRNRRYADFVLGKYNAKINKIKRSQPGRSIDTVLQELEAKGAVGFIVPSTSREANITEMDHEKFEPSSPESSETSEEPHGSAESSIGCLSSDDGTDKLRFNTMIEETIHRKRRDSGVESDEGEDTENINTNPTVNTEETTCKMEAGIQEKFDVGRASETCISESSNILRGESEEPFKRTLQRQEGVDNGRSTNAALKRSSGFDLDIDPVPSISLPVDTDGEELVEMRPRKRRRSSVDAGIGDVNRLSSSTNRSSLSSVGSQDSVTSLLGKRLTLHSEMSLQEEDV